MSTAKSTVPVDFSTPEHWDASMRYADAHAGEGERNTHKPCDACGGSGREGLANCAECAGEGWQPVPSPSGVFAFAVALTREHFAEMRRVANGEHDRAALELFRDEP